MHSVKSNFPVYVLTPVNPYMRQALEQAHMAVRAQEVPVGALVVHPEKGVIASAHNEVVLRKDPTAHAELLAIRQACMALGSERLSECDVYVTLEPCAMCAQAIGFARIRRLYFGAYDPKGGAVEQGARIFSHPTCHHAPEIYGGLLETECAAILKAFFQAKRV